MGWDGERRAGGRMNVIESSKSSRRGTITASDYILLYTKLKRRTTRKETPTGGNDDDDKKLARILNILFLFHFSCCYLPRL